jgi:hypothetical protein
MDLARRHVALTGRTRPLTVPTLDGVSGVPPGTRLSYSQEIQDMCSLVSTCWALHATGQRLQPRCGGRGVFKSVCCDGDCDERVNAVQLEQVCSSRTM